MTHTPDARGLLEQALDDLGLAISPQRVDALWQYALLLNKWNRAYNLSAVRDLPGQVTRHLIDSLSVAPFVSGTRLLDVGSGAGLPGIPLAVIDPERDVTLLDSNGKKSRFQTQAKIELGLNNVTVVQARAETYQPPAPFDVVICRAFAELDVIVAMCSPLCAPEGCILAMKGQQPDAEIEAVAEQVKQISVHRLQVPYSDGERHLVKLQLA